MAEYLVSDPAIQDAHPHTQYDLIANICHEGEPGKGKLMHFLLTNFVLTLVCKSFKSYCLWSQTYITCTFFFG